MSALYSLPHGWRGVVCRWLGAHAVRPSPTPLPLRPGMHPDLEEAIHLRLLPGAALTEARRLDAMAADLAAVRGMVEDFSRRLGPAGDWQT